MALIPGSVRVAGFIAPTDSTDTYAVTDETYNRGGYRTVATVIARDAITPDRRLEGMLVRVSATGNIYCLVGGIANTNWVAFTLPNQALPVQATNIGDTTPDPGTPTIIWSSLTGTLLVWNGSAWISTIPDPNLQALTTLNTTGVLVRTGTGAFATRIISGTAGQIQIFNGDGVASNPSIALVNTGVAPGTYPKVTVDAQGRVTTGTTLVASDIPNTLNLYSENFTTGSPATTSGANSVAFGDGATAQAADSVAIGAYAVARAPGAIMQASGRFISSGDAQVGNYLLKGVTTTNIPRQLYLDGPSGTTPLIIPDNSTWTFKITVTAHRTDINNGHSGYFIKGVLYRQAGPATTALQGSVSVEIFSQSDPSWRINTVADNVNGCLAITVTGESGKTIRWLAHVETVEITG